MILKYGNIKLRPIEKKDSELLALMINSQSIEAMTGGWNVPVSSLDQDKWIENYHNSRDCIRLMIELENGTTIGLISLTEIDWITRRGYISYKTNPEERSRLKGDMKNALYILAKYAFDEMGLHRLEGDILEYNTMSKKLIKSVGFVEEGVRRARVLKNGQWQNQVCYGLLDSEFSRYPDGTAPWQNGGNNR